MTRVTPPTPAGEAVSKPKSIEGYLQKRGPKTVLKPGLLRRRFFMSQGPILAYRKNETDKMPLGRINLCESTCIRNAPAEDYSDCAFLIITLKTYFLVCDSPGERDQWVSQLSQIRQYYVEHPHEARGVAEGGEIFEYDDDFLDTVDDDEESNVKSPESMEEAVKVITTLTMFSRKAMKRVHVLEKEVARLTNKLQEATDSGAAPFSRAFLSRSKSVDEHSAPNSRSRITSSRSQLTKFFGRSNGQKGSTANSESDLPLTQANNEPCPVTLSEVDSNGLKDKSKKGLIAKLTSDLPPTKATSKPCFMALSEDCPKGLEDKVVGSMPSSDADSVKIKEQDITKEKTMDNHKDAKDSSFELLETVSMKETQKNTETKKSGSAAAEAKQCTSPSSSGAFGDDICEGPYMTLRRIKSTDLQSSNDTTSTLPKNLITKSSSVNNEREAKSAPGSPVSATKYNTFRATQSKPSTPRPTASTLRNTNFRPTPKTTQSPSTHTNGLQSKIAGDESGEDTYKTLSSFAHKR